AQRDGRGVENHLAVSHGHFYFQRKLGVGQLAHAGISGAGTNLTPHRGSSAAVLLHFRELLCQRGTWTLWTRRQLCRKRIGGICPWRCDGGAASQVLSRRDRDT